MKIGMQPLRDEFPSLTGIPEKFIFSAASHQTLQRGSIRSVPTEAFAGNNSIRSDRMGYFNPILTGAVSPLTEKFLGLQSVRGG